MWAQASWLAERHQLWYWVRLDLKNAFTRIPHDRALKVIDTAIPNADLRDLLHRIVQRDLPCGKNIRRGCGIPQGSPLSPLLLNLYLAHVLDWPWLRKYPDVPLLRYADDLLLLTSGPEQAISAVSTLRKRLVPHGFILKGKPVLADLGSDQQIDVLGLRLWRVQGSTRMGLPSDFWQKRQTALGQQPTDAEARAARSAGEAFTRGSIFTESGCV